MGVVELEEMTGISAKGTYLSVGAAEGVRVGKEVGWRVGITVGKIVGSGVGTTVGKNVGRIVGWGLIVGDSDTPGARVGEWEGTRVGANDVGLIVGIGVGDWVVGTVVGEATVTEIVPVIIVWIEHRKG
jgi:hypothetical protein